MNAPNDGSHRGGETSDRAESPAFAETMRHIRKRLLVHASLFDDPATYRAGVDDALEAVELAFGAAGGPTVVIDLAATKHAEGR